MLKALIAAVAACCAALLMIAGQAQAWAAPLDSRTLPPTSYSQFYWGPGPYAYGYYGPGPYWGPGPVVAGAAAGAIIGGAIASSAARPPVDPNWIASCSRRYRTFDPNTGTYLAADGQRYVCQ